MALFIRCRLPPAAVSASDRTRRARPASSRVMTCWHDGGELLFFLFFFFLKRNGELLLNLKVVAAACWLKTSWRSVTYCSQVTEATVLQSWSELLAAAVGCAWGRQHSAHLAAAAHVLNSFLCFVILSSRCMGRGEGKGGVWAPDFGMVGPLARPRQLIRIQKRLPETGGYLLVCRGTFLVFTFLAS